MSGSMGPRGQYAATAERRAAILVVAWDVFATQGYRGGSLREISARLGFSQAGVLHHFGSKEKLLMEVLNYRESLNAATGHAAEGIQILDNTRAVVARNMETPGAVRLFVTMSAEATHPDHPAHSFFVHRYRRTMEKFSTAFTLAQMDGVLSADFDPDATARQIIAFLDGIQVQWLISPDFDMLAAFDRYVAELRALYTSTEVLATPN